MDNKKDFTIETEDLEIDENIKEENTPQEKPKEKRKRNFVFTEKRAEALRKGRQKRAENLKKQKADLKELEEIRKGKTDNNNNSFITKPKKKLKEKIPDDSEGEAEGISEYEEETEEETEEEIVYKKKPKPKPKPKKKKVKKIIYLSSSEDEEEADYSEYLRGFKPSLYSKMIKK
jgi:hypothetical protein